MPWMSLRKRKGEPLPPFQLPQTPRGTSVSLVTMSTTMSRLWLLGRLLVEASHVTTFLLCSWDSPPLLSVGCCTEPRSPLLSSRKCVPISPVPSGARTLFTIVHLGPSLWGQSSRQGTMVTRHLQKVEPPPGAITPWDAHPGFSETGNLSSPHCPRITARADPQHSTYVPASGWRPLGSLRKQNMGPMAEFSTPRPLPKTIQPT